MNKIMNLWIIVIILISYLALIFVLEMDIGGDGDGDTIIDKDIVDQVNWSIDKSPYIIIQNITVKEGASLTIEPGVIVEFRGNTGMDIYGNLTAEGSNEDKILFTSSNNKSAGVWRGINYDGNGFFRIDYCRVRYAINGFTIGYNSTGKYHIKNSIFEYNSESGIYITRKDNMLGSINNNLVMENGCGIQYYSRWTDTTDNLSDVLISNTTLKNNRILDNWGTGIYFNLFAVNYAIGSIDNISIIYNTITGNGGDGLYFFNDAYYNSNISNVNILDNKIDKNRGAGIHCFSDAKNAYIRDFNINGNSINNNTGSGILARSYAHFYRDRYRGYSHLYSFNVTNNSISSNGGSGIIIDSDGTVESNINNVSIYRNKIKENSDRGLICLGKSNNNTGVKIYLNIIGENLDGIVIDRGVGTDIIRNYIGKNLESGLVIGKGNTTAFNNDIFGNGKGVLLNGGNLVAKNCYWGGDKGPYHATMNPQGNGDEIVGERVVFTPWCDESIIDDDF